MSISIYYEFDCETCGMGDHPESITKAQAIRMYRKHGGIITADGKTYCCKECYKLR